MRQLFIGFLAEGSTDYRFLAPIIKQTFWDILYDETDFQVEVEVFSLEEHPKGGFNEQVAAAFEELVETSGVICLVVHADADALSKDQVYERKINPALDHLSQQDGDLGKAAIAIVPVYEAEAWMLSNKERFKKEISTSKSDVELGIERPPEAISKPKEVIQKAIQIGRMELPRKVRDKVTISDLYASLGNAIQPADLAPLSSYQDFKHNIRKALKNINWLH